MRRLLALAGLLAAAWTAGLAWYADRAAGLAAPERPTDAIVVLTGGRDRLVTGLRLLAGGQARELFVSGVHRDTTLDAMLGSAAAEGPPCCIVLGHTAADTRGNAEETARWMAERGYRSLRLVTSAYHMPRSLLEFRRALPGVEIVPQPVASAAVHLDEWWRWPGSASLIAGEYNKFLLASLRIELERLWAELDA